MKRPHPYSISALFATVSLCALSAVPSHALDRHGASSKPTVEIHLEALEALKARAIMTPALTPETPISAEPMPRLAWQEGPPGQIVPQEEAPLSPVLQEKAPKPVARKKMPHAVPPPVDVASTPVTAPPSPSAATPEEAPPAPQTEAAAPPPPPPPKMLAKAPPPPPPVIEEPPPPVALSEPPEAPETSPLAVDEMQEPPPAPSPLMAKVSAPPPPPPPPVAEAPPPPPAQEPQLLGQMSDPTVAQAKSATVEVAKAEPAPVAVNKAVELPPPPPPPLPMAEAAPPPPAAVEEAPPPVKAEQQVASAPAPEALPPVEASAEKPAARIVFGTNDTVVPGDMRDQLNTLAAQMKKNDSLRISVVAHASGSADQMSTARRVSLARALAVRAYLIDQGVDNLRINVQAEGNKNPGDQPDRVDLFLVAAARG